MDESKSLMQKMHEFLDRVSFEELIAFIAVADSNSFTAAAKSLDRDASVLSRRVSHLEQRLGVSLLSRTTRRIALTEIGQAYYRRIRTLLDELDNAGVEASNLGGSPQGLLRISLPLTFGKHYIAPMLSGFISKYPRIKVDARFNDRFVDLVTEGFDVAIRVGSLSDSSLIAKKIASFKFLLVASPDFVARHGLPSTPDDILRFPCIEFTNWPEWVLINGKQKKSVRPNGTLIMDNSEAILISALEGAGIAIMADWLATPVIREGKLVQVLPEWRGAIEGGIYSVMPPGKLIPAKTRLFVDEITESIRKGW